MMKYYIYQLQFDSPVHFGQTELGGGLEQITLDYPSDTLFSAVCCEIARQGNEPFLQQFYEKAATGRILLSDLYPYVIDRDSKDECCFYVPKPVMPLYEEKNDGIQAVSYGEACTNSKYKKAMKKMAYVRASRLSAYIEAAQKRTAFQDSVKFGEETLVERVNCRMDEPLPYYVGQYTFRRNAGLYGIIGTDDEQDTSRFRQILTLLGYSGIGGKRSSGYGKFHLYDDFIEMEEQGVYKDDGELYRRLVDDKSEWQMAISMVLPGQADISTVKKGWYRLRKRSGFIDGADAKRDSLYMITSGSCFTERIAGTIAVLNGGGHPVYRCGKGMYLGLI